MNHFSFEKEISKGTYGKIYDGKLNVAIKKINMCNVTDDLKETIRSEIDCLTKLRGHPNIIFLIDHNLYSEEYNSYYYFIMEKMDMSLCDYIKQLGCKQTSKDNDHYFNTIVPTIFKQILKGIQHCHQNNIWHCDLKLNNICINLCEYKVKIIDFGLSYMKNENGPTKYNCFMPIDYQPPEMLLNQTKLKEASFDKNSLFTITSAIDIWCLGLIFSALLRKTIQMTPYQSSDHAEFTLRKLCEMLGYPDNEIWPDWNQRLWDKNITIKEIRGLNHVTGNPVALDILTKMLNIYPNKRPSATECLDHSYFS
jgi:serine/threonine protein kinase